MSVICCHHYFSLDCHDVLIATHSTLQGNFWLKGDQKNPEMAKADLREVTRQPLASLQCRLHSADQQSADQIFAEQQPADQKSNI